MKICSCPGKFTYFQKIYIFSGTRRCLSSFSWFPSSSQLLDGKVLSRLWQMRCQLVIVCWKYCKKHCNTGCFSNFWLQIQQLQSLSDLSTHSMSVPNSNGFNILQPIRVSRLCSGVSYQIKLLPTQINLISCAHRLIQCSAVTADWLVGVSCTPNLINYSNFHYTQMLGRNFQRSRDDTMVANSVTLKWGSN